MKRSDRIRQTLEHERPAKAVGLLNQHSVEELEPIMEERFRVIILGLAPSKKRTRLLLAAQKNTAQIEAMFQKTI